MMRTDGERPRAARRRRLTNAVRHRRRMRVEHLIDNFGISSGVCPHVGATAATLRGWSGRSLDGVAAAEAADQRSRFWALLCSITSGRSLLSTVGVYILCVETRKPLAHHRSIPRGGVAVTCQMR